MSDQNNPFSAKSTLATALGEKTIYRLDALGDVTHLPYSIRVLLEACLRNYDGFIVEEKDVRAVANYNASDVGETEIPFMPARVLLQDFTGVPAVVDLAALRSAMQRMGGDPKAILRELPLRPRGRRGSG